MALPDAHTAAQADRLSPQFTERVLAELETTQRRRSQREARRLGIAMLLIGAAAGLVLIAGLPFRGPGVGTSAVVSWLARFAITLGTLGHQEDVLLARLQLDALPLGVTLLVLACCLLAVWRVTRYERRPGRRPRRRTFVALFALVVVALALALLTPLRAWQTGALRLGNVTIADPSAGAVLVIDGTATVPAGLHGGLSVLGGNAKVAGIVDGDVVTVLGNIELAPTAQVQGGAIAVGGRVHRAPESEVYGDVIGSTPLLAQPARSIFARVRLFVAAWVGLLLLGMALTALFPWPMLLVAATARRFSWQSMLTAVGSGIGLLLVIVPLGLSVAGLPIALALLLVTLLAWTFGLVAVGVAIGRRLLRPVGFGNVTTAAAAIGLAVLGGLAAIPIAGPLLICGAGLLGAGAAVISALDTDVAASALVGPRA